MCGKKMRGVLAWAVLLTLALVACGGGPAVDLVGTEWTLTSLEGKDLLPDTTITATFGEDGTLGGKSGCNSYNTTYETDGDKMVVSELIAATMMMCEEAVMDQEQGYFLSLSATATHEIKGSELTLNDGGGSPRLVFTAP